MTAKTRAVADPYITARMGKLRQKMLERKLAALLVTNFVDVSYLTGFEGDDSFLIVTAEGGKDGAEGRAVLMSDFRYEEQIAREAGWVEVVLRKKAMMEEVGRQLKKMKVTKLGVQAENMTLRQREMLLEQFKKGAKLTLTPVSEIVIALRHIKDQREIQITEHAIAIAEHGFQALRAALQEGMTEGEVASLLVHEMRKRGALNSSFDTIVAAGANGSLPHYRPGEMRIGGNTAVLVDWGARFAGYCSDLTRMVFVGSIPPQIEEIYRIVLDAQLAAIAAIKPGKTGRQIDKVARDIITKRGYGKQFGHGLGHGLGRDIHEAIAFNRLSKVKLEPGMILTVEPGIYLPGVGGVRIEDDILVTESGCRVLSHLPKSLESAKL